MHAIFPLVEETTFNMSISIKKPCSKSRNVPKQMILLQIFFLFVRKQSLRTCLGLNSFSRFLHPLISTCVWGKESKMKIASVIKATGFGALRSMMDLD